MGVAIGLLTVVAVAGAIGLILRRHFRDTKDGADTTFFALLVLLAAAGAALSIIFRLLDVFTGYQRVERVQSSGGLVEAAGQVAAPDTTVTQVVVERAFTQLPLAERLLLITDVLPTVCALAALLVLFKVLTTISTEEVFTIENVKRLERMAFLVVAVIPAHFIAGMASNVVVARQGGEVEGLTFEMSFAPLLIAGVLAVLAHVFRTGIRLRKQSEGLV